MESVSDYDEVEFICIDDNSQEPGTSDYLSTLDDRGWTVLNQQDYREKEDTNKVGGYNDTDHMSPFSNALELFVNKSQGELLVPLQGDVQFIRKGWLQEYVNLYQKEEDIASVTLDAQRKIRLSQTIFDKRIYDDGYSVFGIDLNRRIGGAGDCFYHRSVIEKVGGWKPSFAKNSTPEIDFVNNFYKVYSSQRKVYMPWIPPAVLIATDPRGTNARVRNGRRYGKYWEAKSDNLYYKWFDDSSLRLNPEWYSRHFPMSIEEVTLPNGDWDLPIDSMGNWKKIGTQVDLGDYEIIDGSKEDIEDSDIVRIVNPGYVDEWLESE